MMVDACERRPIRRHRYLRTALLCTVIMVLGCTPALSGISQTNWYRQSTSSPTHRTRSKMAQNDIILRIIEKGAGKTRSAISRVTRAVTGLVAAYISYRGIVMAKDLGVKLLETYKNQEKALTRLNTLVKITTKNWKPAVKELTNYADALEKVGVVGRTSVIAGQAVLASYQIQAESVKALTEGLVDLTVYMANGADVTQDMMVNAANALAKGLIGLPGMLRRSGISMTDFQQSALKAGNESQRVAMMVEVLAQNVGGLNAEMRKTTGGKQSAFGNMVRGLRGLAGKEIGEQLKKSLEPLMQLVQSPEAKSFATSIGKGFASLIGYATTLLPKMLKIVDLYNELRYGPAVAKKKRDARGKAGAFERAKENYYDLKRQAEAADKEPDFSKRRKLLEGLGLGGNWRGRTDQVEAARIRARELGKLSEKTTLEADRAQKEDAKPNKSMTSLIDSVKTLGTTIASIDFSVWAAGLSAVEKIIWSISKSIEGWTMVGTFLGDLSVKLENLFNMPTGTKEDFSKSVTKSATRANYKRNEAANIMSSYTDEERAEAAKRRAENAEKTTASIESSMISMSGSFIDLSKRVRQLETEMAMG